MRIFLVFSTLTLFYQSVFGYPNPLDRSLHLPYGRQLRAILSGRIPDVSPEDIPEELQWWHSIDRNNTIDCKCGQWTTTDEAERWTEEGISQLNEYPWSVSLVAPGQNYQYCGGSLINDRYVLTAASCVDGSIADGVEVLVGSWPKAHFIGNMSDEDELNSKHLYRKKVHRVILHPKYSHQHLDYNIALLRLLGPVPSFGELGGVNPVCLPDSASDNFDGQKTSSLLWRFHDSDGYILPIKRTEVNSQVLSQEDCQGLKYNSEWEKMPDSMMCAKMDEPNPNSPYAHTYDCPGDSGGFLVTEENSRKIQIGIDSWTACYGRPKGVGVYTRISQFLPWIKLHISEDGRSCAY